jgi:tetratricopeptide (TPR) repeat protein
VLTSRPICSLPSVRTLDPRKWGFQWPKWVQVLFFKPMIRVREAMGRYLGEEEHIKFLRKALAHTELVHGRDSPITVTGMVVLATRLSDAGQFDESIALLREAVSLTAAALGADAERTREQKVLLAQTLISSKREYVDASQLLFEAIKSNPTTTREEKIEYFRTNVDFGKLVSRMGLHDVAKKALLTASRGFSEVVGPLDPQTLTAEGWLARALTRDGNLDEALKIRRHVVDGFGRTLGPEHPDSQRSMWNLADLLHQRGENAEAAVLARSVLDWMIRTGRGEDAEATHVRELIAAIDRTATTS